jgi:hypothetical protein
MIVSFLMLFHSNNTSVKAHALFSILKMFIVAQVDVVPVAACAHDVLQIFCPLNVPGFTSACRSQENKRDSLCLKAQI